jgi:hypothetical protein
MHAVLIGTGPEILCARPRPARFIGSGGRNDHNRSPRYHDHENQVGLGPCRSRSLDATRISSERQLPSYASHELREIPVSPPDSPADNLVSQGFLMPSDRIAEAKTFVPRTLRNSGRANGQCGGTLPVRCRSQKWYGFSGCRAPCHLWVHFRDVSRRTGF